MQPQELFKVCAGVHNGTRSTFAHHEQQGEDSHRLHQPSAIKPQACRKVLQARGRSRQPFRSHLRQWHDAVSFRWPLAVSASDTLIRGVPEAMAQATAEGLHTGTHCFCPPSLALCLRKLV